MSESSTSIDDDIESWILGGVDSHSTTPSVSSTPNPPISQQQQQQQQQQSQSQQTSITLGPPESVVALQLDNRISPNKQNTVHDDANTVNTITNGNVNINSNSFGNINKQNGGLPLATTPTSMPLQSVDLCFMLDCTSSMQPYIDTVREDIVYLNDVFIEKFKNLDLRFGVVCYSDFDHGDNRTLSLQFTKSPDEFAIFLSKVVASGGDDGPEDVFGGFSAVFKNNWREQSTKVLVHICDAPCHGNNYHRFKDNFPDGDPFGATHETVMEQIFKLDINYYFGYVNFANTSNMTHIFSQTLQLKSNAKLQMILFDAKDTRDISDSVFRAVSDSLQRSTLKLPLPMPPSNKLLTNSSGGDSSSNHNDSNDHGHSHSSDNHKHKISRISGSIDKSNYTDSNSNIILDPNVPDWNNSDKYMLIEKVMVKRFSVPWTIRDCLNPKLKMLANNVQCSIKIAKKPFAKGRKRLAYYGYNLTTNQHIVLKEYINSPFNFNNKKKMFYDFICVQSVASKFAMEFNKTLGLDKSGIKFRFAQIAEGSPPTLYFTEKFYSKQNIGDSSWENHSISPYLQAFTHWTFEVSNRTMMVSDIKLVNTEHGVIQTDPLIHSVHRNKFGSTNLGRDEMERFLSSHTCNDICHELKLPNKGLDQHK